MQNSVRKYLSEIGKKGGLVSSEAKAKAVRENGKLGGRPKSLSEKIDSFGMPQLLVEMARFGDYKGLSFWVYTEPLKNPSFHLKHKTDFEIVLQMKDLKILEIKNNDKPKQYPFKKGDLPLAAILKTVKEFLALKNPKLPTVTNAQYFDALWDSLNS